MFQSRIKQFVDAFLPEVIECYWLTSRRITDCILHIRRNLFNRAMSLTDPIKSVVAKNIIKIENHSQPIDI